MKKIDILVAVRNESENIINFINEIKKINIEGVELSIIFLEDGSTDNTVSILQAVSRKFNFVKYYSLKNDFGQYVALYYGIHLSDADAVITMDVDGGHPLFIIEEMVNEYLNGYNLIQGHRVVYESKEKYRALASYLYNWFFLIFIGLNIVKQNSIFRLMDRNACEIIKDNYLWGYALKTNFKYSDKIRIKYIAYDTPVRSYGVSNYNLLRLAKLSMRVAYSQLSVKRCLLFSFILLGFAVISSVNANYYLMILFFLLTGLLMIPYFSLRKINPITRMKILESGGK